MKLEMVICTHCKFRDNQNSFKLNEVTVTAAISQESVTENISKSFIVECAKCNKCKKILFTRMARFKKLKKQAEEYFKSTYNLDKVKFTGIDLISVERG
jgi:hypothetical protein